MKFENKLAATFVMLMAADGNNGEIATSESSTEQVTSTTVSAISPTVPAAATSTVQSAPKPTKFCQHCGAEINQMAEICPKCGVRVALEPSLIKEPKSRTTAILLAFFLGGIGIHKLYLGSGNWWLYLLFCWTFIPAIIAFIEFIQLAIMSDATFHAKYG
jgi:ribosomal protein L40E